MSHLLLTILMEGKSSIKAQTELSLGGTHSHDSLHMYVHHPNILSSPTQIVEAFHTPALASCQLTSLISTRCEPQQNHSSPAQLPFLDVTRWPSCTLNMRPCSPKGKQDELTLKGKGTSTIGERKARSDERLQLS